MDQTKLLDDDELENVAGGRRIDSVHFSAASREKALKSTIPAGSPVSNSGNLFTVNKDGQTSD